MLTLKQERIILTTIDQLWKAITKEEEISQWRLDLTKVEYSDSPRSGVSRLMIAPHSRFKEEILVWKPNRELGIKRIPLKKSKLRWKKQEYRHETILLDPIEPHKTRIIWRI